VTLSFVDVLEMTLQFILAGKAIVASIFASNHKTWILGCSSAMSGLIVSLEVTPFSHGSMAVFLKACVFAGFDEMGFLMFCDHPVPIGLITPKDTTWSFPFGTDIVLFDPQAQTDRTRTIVGNCKGRMRARSSSYIVDLNGRGEVGFTLLR